MKTSTKEKCRRCGAEIPAALTESLCPACLMTAALAPTSMETETVLTTPPPRSVTHREPSEFPCQFGGYRLLGLLGTGGMGTVYEAELLATKRRVALKMLLQQLDSPETRYRFLREGRLAASVRHPNSLYIFGSEEIAGIPVITMEIAGGGTLNDKLKKYGRLPVAEAVDAILDVTAGLEAALAAGVLHRDVKPSNCFVNPDGSVKVGDFGLSVSTLAEDDSFVTATGAIMGTPAFASPEQLRGDELDVRADIYSVGATLFTLLTGQVPFEGKNAVQIVANVINQKPKALNEFRKDAPPGLERVVARCLAKEPDQRYSDYPALRNALLPFSSREPEPASIKVRLSAGWIDYLVAFLIPYVAIMLLVGGEQLLLRPFAERTLYSARYYVALLTLGFAYFSVVEGIWGAGLGKALKGLRVVRPNGRTPGMGRALLRIVIPFACVEGVRIPLLMASISDFNQLTGPQIGLFVGITNACAWIPVLLTLRARRENGYATVWDLLSGTRVLVKPVGAERPAIRPAIQPETPTDGADWLGPYRVIKDMGSWIIAMDPVLRREIWLLLRDSGEPSRARRNLARHGRLRWLQKVETDEATWDAFEAIQGALFSSLVESGKRLPWSDLRHWLHDLASELWNATRDQTLPPELSLDQVWITSQGSAVLLDDAWPDVKRHAERIPVNDPAGQQRFLSAIAGCVESTSLPVHARSVLQNLADRKFEKLSFLVGSLTGLLDKPAEVSGGVRAGSIFMLPLYVWILVFIGYYRGGGADGDELLGRIVMISVMVVLSAIALIQLLGIPFHSTISHSIFRLAVVDVKGKPAGPSHLLLRWAIVWLPLFVPMAFVALMIMRGAITAGFFSGLVLLFLWISAAAYAVIHPNRGLHDRLARTWVVRR
jgi:uncharacterized RDD family membrane protein YckC